MVLLYGITLAILGLGYASPIGSQEVANPAEILSTDQGVLEAKMPWSQSKAETINTGLVIVQSDWVWSCPRRGRVPKMFKWRGLIKNNVAMLQPMDNVDYFDPFKIGVKSFRATWHHDYCVQEKGFNCAYRVRGTAVGGLQGQNFIMGLAINSPVDGPHVEEACVETAQPFRPDTCPSPPGNAFKACVVLSTETKSI